jgi:hypothetical protein
VKEKVPPESQIVTNSIKMKQNHTKQAGNASGNATRMYKKWQYIVGLHRDDSYSKEMYE